MKKVVKFGGSSLASAEQFKKVGDIIRADESRVYVVPSAPGKRFSDDTKVTDMLLHVYETASEGKDITEEMLADTKMLHAGSFGMSADPSRTAHFEAMKLAKKLGKLISYDVNYRNMIWSFEDAKKVVDEVLPYVDLLKISDEELDFVGGEANIPAMMKENQISVVIETLGAKGAKFFFAGQEETVEGHKVKAVDATGAGDAFWGGFLASLLMNGVTTVDDLTVDKIREALKYGNASGGLCVQKMGGIPALPTKEEIEAFIK